MAVWRGTHLDFSAMALDGFDQLNESKRSESYSMNLYM